MNPTEKVTEFVELSEEIDKINRDMASLEARLKDKIRQKDVAMEELKRLISGTGITERHIKTKSGKVVRINAQGIKVLEVE